MCLVLQDKRMELLEREQFFNELETILGDVAGGNGRFVLVSGEAGIGKTTLVEHFAEANKQQARVLWGACDALFTPRPLGPLYDIAHQTRGPLLSLLEDEAPRGSIFSAVLDELQNTHSPTIAVTEDAHWADEATLDLLKFLGRRINRTNSMLVVTFRDDELDANHPLRQVLGDLPPRSVARLRLPPLSEAGVKTLAESEGRPVEDLYPVTGGNPFFVTEALASAEPGVPETVRDAVLSRAARLSPAARAIVELVSVTPARTELSLLNDTMRPEPGALEVAVGAGMLRYEGDAISFRHELARRAVEDSLSVSESRRLHALILKTLLGRIEADWRPGLKTVPARGHDALPARIVHHASQADDRQVVREYAPIAARQAAALNAHREAATHYQTALQYADTLASEARAELLERRSYECFLTDQIEEALTSRREALEIWTRLGDKLRQGDNLRWMSRFTWSLGRNKEAEAHSIEAVRLLESLNPGPELAMAYSNRAQLHMLAEDCPQAVLWGSRAIELAEKLGATEILVHALNNVGTAEVLANDEHGRIKLEESLKLALTNSLHEHTCRAYTNLADSAVRARKYPVALRWFEDGIAHAIEHELEFCKLYLIAERARAYFEQGDWDRAADDAGSVLESYRVPAITRISALAVLGHVRVRRGDPDAAQPLNEARELALGTGELQRIAPVASARTELMWLKGDLEQVISLAGPVLEMAKGHHDLWIRGEFTYWIWRAGGVIESSEEIAAPYALQISGDWRAAAAAWKQVGCPYEEAMALGDGDEAAKLRAVEILEGLGAGPALERLRKSLRDRGVRGIPRGPRPSTKENPAGLTNRQVEVLSFMAEGLSNAVIAERLFISAKTVDHHVSAILAKLDARTRAEAVAVALQSNLIKAKQIRHS